MKRITISIVASGIAALCCTASAKEPPRIDATSDGTFDTSFVKLAKSLRGYEPRRLALGLFGVLISHKCLSSETIIHLTFNAVSAKDAQRIRPCREHLHGKSFLDIVEEADAAQAPPVSKPPNNLLDRSRP